MWFCSFKGRHFVSEMRTSHKGNRTRYEWLCPFLFNCWGNNICRYYYKHGVINYMGTNFKYILNPIFLFSSALYTANKLLIFPFNFINCKFTRFYLNDLLLVPVLLPIILFFSRVLRFRRDNFPPRFIEIVIPVAIWSIAFEFIGPHFFGKGTSDPFDVLAYCMGGFLSWLAWNRSSFIDRLPLSARIRSTAHSAHIGVNQVIKICIEGIMR
jgi:hypothetical protein